MSIPAIIEKIYARAYLRAALHLLFWLLLFIIKLYLTHISFNSYRAFPLQGSIYINLANTLLLAAFYYTFVYAIMPGLFLKSKYFKGAISTLLLLFVYTATDAFAEINIIHLCETCALALEKIDPGYAAYLKRGFLNIILTRLLSLGTPVLLLFALCIPLSIKMTLHSFRTKLHSLQLELNFLSAQLNPHFLFNSMNNIYGLIIKGDTGRSAELVARLSDLLRYTLYDTNKESISIEKEIKLIRDYIELEKVRLNDTRVTFDYHSDEQPYALAPLLLMPVIENAFKHGGDTPDSFIDIQVKLSAGKLNLSVKNSTQDASRDKAGGIGLSNFKKRMDLYYPGKYSYKTDISHHTYSTNLTIQL